MLARAVNVAKVLCVSQHCGHHTCGTVRRRGDHASARSVFFVHSDRVRAYPVERFVWRDATLTALGEQLIVNVRSASFDVEAARQLPACDEALVDADRKSVV